MKLLLFLRRHWRRRFARARSFPARRVRSLETLERRQLLTAEGEAFTFSQNINTAGLVGAVSSTVQWGDGTSSAAAVSATSTGNLRVVFDYSLDSSRFFADPVRRATLQAAADSIVSRLGDDLAAIQPSGSNVWTPAILHPRTGNPHELSSSLVVPANQILIYVGARDLANNQVGEGAGGYFTRASGTQAWLDNVRARGESGALAAVPSDVGPWGGSLAFDEPRDWYFGTGAAGLESGQTDFFSVAAHELAHVLGFGLIYPGSATGSWEALVSGGQFTGAKSRALYGANVPLSGGSHWQNGLESDGRETAMDSSLTTGERALFTPLDFAGLDDIGWSVLDTRATVTAEHTYGDNGSYPIGLLVRGSRGGELSYSFTASISNTPPQATAVGTQTIIVGQPLSIVDVVEIVDPGFRVNTASPPTAETFDVTIRWGDGSADQTLPATIDQFGNASRPTLASVDAVHTFTQPGTYTARVIVRDDDGGQAIDTFQINVTEVPRLTLSLSPGVIDENDGAQAATLTVSRSGPASSAPQTILLRSDDPTEAQLPASVVIPAGQTSVSVAVRAVDDALLDGTQTVSLSATGDALQPGAVDLLVRDVESITGTLNVAQISEDAATGALQLTVRRSNTDRAEAVMVTLGGGDAQQIVAPRVIIIAAGQAATTVPLTPVNDQQPEAPLTLTYSLTAAGYQSATVTIDLQDDEPPYFQNPQNPFDVDQNGIVEPFDALKVINQLNLASRQGGGVLDPQDATSDLRFIDVDGDYLLTPTDALLVINELNRQRRDAEQQNVVQGEQVFIDSEAERRRQRWLPRSDR